MAVGSVATLTGWRLWAARLAYAGILALAVVTFSHAVPHWVSAALVKAPPSGARELPSATLIRIDIVAALAVPVVSAAVAAVILRHRSRDWFGLFASLEAMLFGLAIAGPWSSVPLSDPWSLPTRVAIKLALIAIVMVLYTFPTGNFAPRWTRWLLVVFATWTAVSTVITAADPVIARGLWQLLLVAFLFSGLAAQAFRFTRVSSPTERRQTKWIFYGLALIIAAYALWSFVEFGTHNQVLATLADIVVQLASIASAALFGIAMIRFRLYDIDLVVNRTILYGSATALLVIGRGDVRRAQRALQAPHRGSNRPLLRHHDDPPDRRRRRCFRTAAAGHPAAHRPSAAAAGDAHPLLHRHLRFDCTGGRDGRRALARDAHDLSCDREARTAALQGE